MVDFVTLSCPNCGGALKITENIDRFACAFCGREHIVIRSGGVIALTPVMEAINKVGIGVDKTASELAIIRLQKEIPELFEQRKAIVINDPPNFIGLIIFFVILGFLSVFAGFALGCADSIDGNFFSLKTILLIVGGFITIYFGIILGINNDKRINKGRDAENNKYSVIDNQIRKKQADLEHHKKTVNR